MPILGSGFILWPWTVISLIYGEYRTAVWLIATYGLIFVTRQLLEPRVLGKQIGLHPILTLMSIYIGLKVFGGFGFILGPFTLIMIKTVLSSETKIV
jgi:predicted PurR-regulated permease PerM